MNKKMSDLCSDRKNSPFVKSANSVVDLYEQYVHDLGDVLINMQSPVDANFKDFVKGPRIHLIKVFTTKLLSVIYL